MCVYIFAGRFQPFHNGHLQVFERACKLLGSLDTLVLGVVSPYESTGALDRDFVDVASEHHLPERNPWAATIPLCAVTRIARSSPYSNQIITTLLPRPEYGWNIIATWFPQDRIWVVPDASEPFDDSKSEFFKSRGDRVIRIPDDTGISGRELRDYYNKNDYAEFSIRIPLFLAEIYFREKKADRTKTDFQLRARVFEKYSKWVTDSRTNAIPSDFLGERVIGDLLDAGGGTGYLSWYLLERHRENIKSVTIVDVSQNMLDEAKKKRDFQDVMTFNMGLERFCMVTDKRYDTVLIRQVLHYVENVQDAIESLKRVLKPTGFLYVGQIIVPDDECAKWLEQYLRALSPSRRRLFTKDTLHSAFKDAGFETVCDEYVEFEEDFNSFYYRVPSFVGESSFDALCKDMINRSTESIREKLKINITERDLTFKAHFCHLLLKLSGA